EFDNALELLFFTRSAEATVIAVLRAAFLVDADRLQRRRITPGDAHVAPRRRNAKFPDASERLVVADQPAVGISVAEAGSFAAEAPDAVKVERPTTRDALLRHAPAILREWCRWFQPS